MEDYWTRRVKLNTALKKGAAIPMARATEGDEDDDEEEAESPEGGGSQVVRLAAKAKAHRLGKTTKSSTLGAIVRFISRLSRASTEAIATIGPPPMFDPVNIFFDYLEVEFGGIQRDPMRHTQDFKKEVEDTPRIMYVRLAKFARESNDAFRERQLVSLYMTKQDIKLQDMTHPHMLLMYNGRVTLPQTFVVVEQLDKGLCSEEAGRLPTTITTSVVTTLATP